MTEPLEKSTIISLIKKHSNKIASFGIKKLGLFGSFVREEQTVDSDIDFLVEFEPDKETFKNFMNFIFFLEDVFGRKVEVVTPDSISPYLAPYILKEVEYVSYLH